MREFTCSQLSPPSVLRYTPPSPDSNPPRVEFARPPSGGQSAGLPPPPGYTAPRTSTSAYTSFGSTGDHDIPMRPFSDRGSPFSIFVQVSPPSTDLYMSEPGPVGMPP